MLNLLHKTCWGDFTLGSPDWTVRLNAITVHVVPARVMQLLEWCDLFVLEIKGGTFFNRVSNKFAHSVLHRARLDKMNKVNGKTVQFSMSYLALYSI